MTPNPLLNDTLGIMKIAVTSSPWRNYSGLLIMRAAILCCSALVLVGSVLAASEPPSTTSKMAGHKKQPQPAQPDSKPTDDDRGTEKKPIFVKSLESEEATRERERLKKEGEEKARNDAELVHETRDLAVATNWLAGFTLFIVFVTGGQLYMFLRQLRIMRDGAKDAKTTADAAKANADSALLSLRPWLSCEIELGEPLAFNAEGDAVFAFHFVIKNVGHSPAMAVQFWPHLSLFEFHHRSMAHLRTMAELNRNMGVNATTVLIPSGISMGREEYGPIIFPGGSKTFNYRIPLKRSDLEKSCEDISPNTNFSPEVFAIVFYTYPSATVRASTAVIRMILKIGGAFELDKPVGLDEMRLEDASGDFAT